jgi:hypothetical protein
MKTKRPSHSNKTSLLSETLLVADNVITFYEEQLEILANQRETLIKENERLRSLIKAKRKKRLPCQTTGEPPSHLIH